MESLNLIISFSIILGFYAISLYGLDSSKYEEAGCATVTPDMGLKDEFISKYAAWNVPLASTWFYHQWYEKFTNQSAPPNTLQNICLKFVFLASQKEKNTYIVAAAGAGKILTYECSSTSPQSQTCNQPPQTLNFQTGVESEETIVKTDNANYIMLVTCVRKKLKAFYVMTPNGTDLAPENQKAAGKFALSLGFASDKMSLISYAACPKPKS